MKFVRRLPRSLAWQRRRNREPTAEAPTSDRKNLGRFLEMARPYRVLISVLILIGVVRFALQLVTL